jgi:septum site-determining protein MinC
MPEFFDGDAMVIDLAPLQGEADVDFEGLIHLLRGYRLLPVAVKGAQEAQLQRALAAGLVKAEDARALETQAQKPQPQEQPQPAAPLPPPASALIIDKPLRSGQQVYARGRDLVVLSMVNPGAEVIADGHIHVYAPLRGKAIAGARGDADARILTLCLEPELVSIAGVYRTSEVPWPDALRGKPAQLRLQGEKLVMEPLNP